MQIDSWWILTVQCKLFKVKLTLDQQVGESWGDSWCHFSSPWQPHLSPPLNRLWVDQPGTKQMTKPQLWCNFATEQHQRDYTLFGSKISFWKKFSKTWIQVMNCIVVNCEAPKEMTFATFDVGSLFLYQHSGCY